MKNSAKTVNLFENILWFHFRFDAAGNSIISRTNVIARQLLEIESIVDGKANL